MKISSRKYLLNSLTIGNGFVVNITVCNFSQNKNNTMKVKVMNATCNVLASKLLLAKYKTKYYWKWDPLKLR